MPKDDPPSGYRRSDHSDRVAYRIAKRRFMQVKRESRYYWRLWESLTYDELLSMRKSNRFPKDLLRSFKLYMLSRGFREYMPLIVATALASIVMNEVSERWRNVQL